MDSEALNYDPEANVIQETALRGCGGLHGYNAYNYNELANMPDEEAVFTTRDASQVQANHTGPTTTATHGSSRLTLTAAKQHGMRCV